MTVESVPQTIAAKWNLSTGKNFNWDKAEIIAINFKANLVEGNVSSNDGANTENSLNIDVKTSRKTIPANDRVLNILMVEDSLDDCDLICHQLGKCGFIPRVERVFCEKTMRAALDKDQWDIVFTDHGLPGFTGIAAMDLLRQMERSIPVICITGSMDPVIIRQILAAGADACISKNDLSLLCRAVNRALTSPKQKLDNSSSEL